MGSHYGLPHYLGTKEVATGDYSTEPSPHVASTGIGSDFGLYPSFGNKSRSGKVFRSIFFVRANRIGSDDGLFPIHLPEREVEPQTWERDWLRLVPFPLNPLNTKGDH